MAIWSFLAKFKSLFTTGFFTLIPGVNVLATIIFSVNETKGIPGYYYRLLEKYLQEPARTSAFNHNTRDQWVSLGAALLTCLVFVSVSAYVNNYFITTYATNEYYISYVPTWVTGWANYAMYAVVGAVAVAQVYRMFNAIYQAHKEYDVRFMDDDRKAYWDILQKRKAEEEARKASRGN